MYEMILRHPHPKLLAACRPVDREFIESGGLSELISAMVRRLTISHGGIGLAANQVGGDRRVIVVAMRRGEQYIMVNPEITKQQGRVRSEERCLSVTGQDGNMQPYTVTRPKRLRVRFQEPTRAGWLAEHRHISASGLLAQCIAHEVDHLDGISIVERSKGLAA